MRFLKNNIRDIFYGANDGIVTTFAIVTGAIGASLSHNIILVLGFASLIADGFSMAASNYLGTRSEREIAHMNGDKHSGSLYKPAAFTFVSFIAAGSLPLLPFVFGNGGFVIAAIATGLTLFLIGGVLGHLVLHRGWLAWGFEMLLIGGIASGIAFAIGRLVGHFISA